MNYQFELNRIFLGLKFLNLNLDYTEDELNLNYFKLLNLYKNDKLKLDKLNFYYKYLLGFKGNIKIIVKNYKNKINESSQSKKTLVSQEKTFEYGTYDSIIHFNGHNMSRYFEEINYAINYYTNLFNINYNKESLINIIKLKYLKFYHKRKILERYMYKNKKINPLMFPYSLKLYYNLELDLLDLIDKYYNGLNEKIIDLILNINFNNYSKDLLLFYEIKILLFKKVIFKEKH